MEPKTSVITKGDIYVIHQNYTPTGSEIWAERPAIIISNDTINKHSDVVMCVYLTTSKNKNPYAPTHVHVISGNRLAIAMCEQIVSVDKSRLGEYVGSITSEELDEVNKACLFSLDISNSTRYAGWVKKWENYINKYNLSMTPPVEESKENEAKYLDDFENNRDELDAVLAELESYKSKYELLRNSLSSLLQQVDITAYYPE